jgi:hypothetical protein
VDLAATSRQNDGTIIALLLAAPASGTAATINRALKRRSQLVEENAYRAARLGHLDRLGEFGSR